MKINSVLNPVDIAISGMRAQGKNMELISSNVAMSRTNGVNGSPYRRQEAVFETDNNAISGVNAEKTATDGSELQKVFEPGNPMADENGQVTVPNINLPIEMMNLSIATRAYQASTAVLKRYQKMVETTLELLR